MQSENPLIADFVKLANAAAGTLAGVGRVARDGARERMREAVAGLDFVVHRRPPLSNQNPSGCCTEPMGVRARPLHHHEPRDGRRIHGRHRPCANPRRDGHRPRAGLRARRGWHGSAELRASCAQPKRQNVDAIIVLGWFANTDIGSRTLTSTSKCFWWSWQMLTGE